MKKNTVRSKKTQQKKTEKLFIRVMCVLLVLVMILGLVEAVIGGGSNTGSTYTVTEDGHVHAADGSHIGTVEELFGEGAGTVVTEDGHIHAEDGTHIGTVGEEGAAAE